MDPPIRQGGMRYPHVVMHFKKDKKVPSIPITLPAYDLFQIPRMFLRFIHTRYIYHRDQKEKEQFKGLPEEFKDAELYDVVNKLFRALTQRKITTPGSFKSYNGASAVKCALKAQNGYLYPLERSFFFVHKPTLYPAMMITFNMEREIEEERLMSPFDIL